TRVILRVSAETIPGEGFSGARIIRKEVQKMFLQEGIKTPQPIMTPFNHSENGV
ncbi:mechanosensitive ion channel family protein, partial [Staphylococcus aureus]|nr:mechanosensitive ion channel family protein [Staphylococcus aureus]MBR9575385.1 mechanosensitive ion channel family protein [Staphylococcus aureus]